MPYIKTEEGIKLFVEDVNPDAKQAILFIHGWPASHNMFEYQFNKIPKSGFRCLGVDIRGFGKSDKPWKGYSYNRLADDIRCVIEAFDLEDIILVGFSMGGAISVRYMARHAGYGIAKLALISAAVPVFTQRPDYPYSLPIAEVDKLIAQTYTDRPQMISDFGSKFFASYVSVAFRNWFTEISLEASGHATAMTAISLRDEDLRHDLPKICVPTTIFHGIHDQIVPFPNAEITHQHIKGSSLIPFELSGHGLIIDELNKFNYCFTQFLRQ
jgi:non-heme chloroperoxidase